MSRSGVISLITCVLGVHLGLASVQPLAAVSSVVSTPGLIAYDTFSLSSSGPAIFTSRPDGTDNRLILPGAFDPEWSPDGQRVLYTHADPEQGLWSALADGSDARPVIRPRDYQVGSEITDGTWSPSARRIAFVGASQPDEYSVSTIYTVASDGSRLKRLRSGSNPAWYAGGRRLVFTFGGFHDRIATMRASGGGFRGLVGPSKGYRSQLTVSPDGRTLAFLERIEGRAAIGLLDLRTGWMKTLRASVTGTGDVDAVAWTPSGRRLAFLGGWYERRGSSVFTIRSNGSGKRRLFAVPSGDYASTLSWQPPQ